MHISIGSADEEGDILLKTPSKSQIVGAIAIATGLALAGTGVIHAANTGTAQTSNPMNGLVNAIAQKFNLNASDVQQVFDQQRAQMDAQHQQEFEARVAQGVKDGKITQVQADQIVAKAKELQASRQSEQANSANQTEAERDAARKAQMDSLKEWATQNNIPKEFMLFGGMGHGGPGHHAKPNN